MTKITSNTPEKLTAECKTRAEVHALLAEYGIELIKGQLYSITGEPVHGQIVKYQHGPHYVYFCK